MQVISKIEPTSPSSTSSIITPKSSNDLMQAITTALRRGQESANQLRILSNKRLGFKVEGDHDHHHHHHHDSTTTITKEFDDDFQRFFDHHSWVTLNSFDTCISMIKSYDFDQQIVNKKRKVDRAIDDDHDDDHSSKSEEISDAKVSKERRGCYKRRKTGQTWTVEATNLIDDGYGWRKYGQKEILHTKYPRNYYRCTHKHDQNCLATKQVQQTSANPTKYTIIYNGQHTCNNLQKTSSSIVIDDDSLDEKSSFFLSFATNNNHPTPKHGLNSSMFPSTTFQNNTSSTTMIKQDHTLLVKEESSPLVAPPPPPPQQQQQQQHDDDHHCGHDHHHVAHKQYPSSSSSSSENNHPSSSSDITSTGLSPSSSTPVSELSDVISPTVTYSSTPGSAFELMDEEIFLGIMNLKQDFFYPHLDALLNE